MRFDHSKNNPHECILPGKHDKYRLMAREAILENRKQSESFADVFGRVREEFIGNDSEPSPYEVNLFFAALCIGEAFGAARVRAVMINMINKVEVLGSVGMIPREELMGAFVAAADDFFNEGMNDIMPISEMKARAEAGEDGTRGDDRG